MDSHHIEHTLRLIACPSLNLEHGKIDKYVPEGATVAEHLRAIGWQPDGLYARVFINGDWIEKAQWEFAVPRAGQALTIRVIPFGGGGGGGENGKSALRIVAMLAIVIAGAAVSSGALAGPLGAGAESIWGAGGWAAMQGGMTGALAAGAAVTIAGTLAMNGLIPTPRARRALPRPGDAHRLVAA